MTLRAYILPAMTAATLLAAPLKAQCAAWEQMAPVADAVLEEQRGGFLVANGVAFDFGAVMRTFVDGQLALETTLTWTQAGAITQQTAYSAVPVSTSTIQTALANAGLTGSALAGASSFTANGGQTTLIQNASNGALTNAILTTASNQAITQDLAVTLTLQNGATFANSINTQQLGFSIGNTATQAAVGAMSR